MRGGLVAIAVFAFALAPSLAHADDEEVKVHIDGDPQLVVERKLPDVDLWETVCRGTCDELLPRDGLYRLGGVGVRPSLPLSFKPEDGRVWLDVKARFSAGWYGSIFLTVLGPIAMFSGTIATIAGVSQNNNQIEDPCAFQSSCNTSPPTHGALIGGVTGLITGLAMTIAGVVGLSDTSHSTVRRMGHVELTGRGVVIRF